MLAGYSSDSAQNYFFHREELCTDRSIGEEEFLPTVNILIPFSESLKITLRMFLSAEKCTRNTADQLTAAASGKRRLQRENTYPTPSLQYYVTSVLCKINSGLCWCVIKWSHIQAHNCSWGHKQFFCWLLPCVPSENVPGGQGVQEEEALL